ncbi:hypothetical protein BDP27DRAFT_1341214 [Rhodocollybia butyracea]|uniref:Uncharacterized protein n=1 Tax=Rhodocollybia butyracea TaxID=206335 RepID=A0A9P5TYQ5_9AGAR|nr:hypothetical protein BDP27DRAFT_1341214 [Rhodocollybia butyracea]
MSLTKSQHYWSQLRLALVSGQWASSDPAKNPSGQPLPWPELFRKFKKHCASDRELIEVVEQVRELALLISVNESLRSNSDGGEHGEEDEYLLELGNECMLAPERIDEARTGYDVLKKCGSNFDTLNSALAYYAYALGKPEECLAHLAKVPDVSPVLDLVPLPVTLRAATNGSSSANLNAGTNANSISLTEIKQGRAWAMAETLRSVCLQGMSHEKLFPNDPSKALGTYAAAFPILAIVETELASPSHLPSHSYSYLHMHSHSRSTASSSYTSFTRYREIWRWVERLLWRAIILAARVFDVFHDHRVFDSCTQPDSLWTWLEHYSTCSVHWPPGFRSAHRSAISVIYLRAVVLRYGQGKNGKSKPTWLPLALSIVSSYRSILSLSTTFPKAGQRNRKVEDFVDLCVAIWETASVNRGEGWVIDILHWSTTLTFNSYNIQKHLTRLLYVSGDTHLARRTLRLYIQIVSKAYQTWYSSSSTSEGSISEPEGFEISGVEARDGREKEREADTDKSWVQTCVFGARMICKIVSSGSSSSGSRPSSYPPSSVKEIMDDLKEAGDLIEKAKTRLNREAEKELAASVDVAEGIWLTVVAFKQHNPDTRSLNLIKAHTLFLRSIALYPTPAAHYHVSISYARYIPPPPPRTRKNERRGTSVGREDRETKAEWEVGVEGEAKAERDAVGGEAKANQIADDSGNTDGDGHTQNLLLAIQHAATAAEGSPSEIRYWHLLGLLSAKTEQWEAAEGALDMGAAIDEPPIEDEGREKEVLTDMKMLIVPGVKPNGVNGVVGTIDGLPLSPMAISYVPDEEESTPVYVLPSQPQLGATHIQFSPFRTLLPPPSHPPASPSDKFEYALQLRMTQVAVAEYVEGAEGAAERLREVFGWIAEEKERRGVGIGIGGGGNIAEGLGKLKTPTPSELALYTSASAASTTSLGHEEIKALHDAATTGAETSTAPYTVSRSLSQTGSNNSNSTELHPPMPIPIMISPATPDDTTMDVTANANVRGGYTDAHGSMDVGTDKDRNNVTAYAFASEEHLRIQTQTQPTQTQQAIQTIQAAQAGQAEQTGQLVQLAQTHERDPSKSKKMQQKLKNQVQKGSTRISTISRKIGHGVVRNGSLRKLSSMPDFHAVLRPTSYQASSIHSRRRIAAPSPSHSQSEEKRSNNTSSPPLPPPSTLSLVPPASKTVRTIKQSQSQAQAQTLTATMIKENRLLSDLWLMSAATFRRLGKIEQAKGAIQEAEVRDATNPGVWVQLGLYYLAPGSNHDYLGLGMGSGSGLGFGEGAAKEAFQKALFIDSEDVGASVHLARMYLFPEGKTGTGGGGEKVELDKYKEDPDNIDLAAGLLAHLTQGAAWDVPEAWYFLAKAYGMQGRMERERECLTMSLRLSESRGVRDFVQALGLCL